MMQTIRALALIFFVGASAFAGGSYQIRTMAHIVKTYTDVNGTEREKLEPMHYDTPAGTVVQYDVNVTNNKKRPLNEIKVIFHIPEGSTFLGSDLNETVYVTEGEDIYPEGDLKWVIPTIPAESARFMSYRVKTGERF